MPGKLRKSFVGHPSAKFFGAFFSDRVFQQPLRIALTDGVESCSSRHYPQTHVQL
jgi:hypothetical protein